MKILFSGGGTGGHIYPALAIRDLLVTRISPAPETAYLGVAGGMEEKIVGRLPACPFLPITAQGMPRDLSLQWLTFPWRNLKGIAQAVRHFRSFQPDLLITTGGFVAFPALLAARMLGVPFVMHEQNAVMGITNRLFAASASRVLLSMPIPATQGSPNIVLTGNPVRAEFFRAADSNTINRSAYEFCLLAVGGSRGALSINRAMVEFSDRWLGRHPEVLLIHITGERDFEAIRGKVPVDRHQHLILPYLHEMKAAFDAADVVVSRAGATILAEIAHCGKPAILIPFPFATDNHQDKNARFLEESGAAFLIPDHQLTCDTLVEKLLLAKDPDRARVMGEKIRASRPEDVEGKIFEVLQPFLAPGGR